jgi:YD repeat-containing protein
MPYDTNHRLLTKTDAKGQQIVNTYDSYGRVTEVQRFYPSGGSLVEDTSQQVDYSYDSNPYNGSYSQYTLGRLAAVKYSGGNCSSLGPMRQHEKHVQHLESDRRRGKEVHGHQRHSGQPATRASGVEDHMTHGSEFLKHGSKTLQARTGVLKYEKIRGGERFGRRLRRDFRHGEIAKHTPSIFSDDVPAAPGMRI